jgi:hypothetical protein
VAHHADLLRQSIVRLGRAPAADEAVPAVEVEAEGN